MINPSFYLKKDKVSLLVMIIMTTIIIFQTMIAYVTNYLIEYSISKNKRIAAALMRNSQRSLDKE